VITPPATGIQTDPVESFNCAECTANIDVKGLPSFSDVTCPQCGARASVPARLANFQLLKLMGTGGMGGVYYARDEGLGRFVAIKVMLQSLGNDPVFIENFKREAQAVAKLNHPNIAQIYSFGQEKGQPYIVMELVSGERVDAMMESQGCISPALAMQIGLEIAQGLSAADEAGLVHGDIKPENILLDTKGRAKLVDFGLATVAHEAAGEGIWGTPYYIAPEKIRRQKVDARADIYSLGATLYHMLTGKPPFEGKTPVEVVKARLEQPPPDPRKVKPGLPEIITSIITRMLAVEKTDRYPNYLSLISDLNKAVAEFRGAGTNTSRSKQFRIKKRNEGGGEPEAEEPAEAAASGSKKLVIHRDGKRPSTTQMTAKTPGTTTGRLRTSGNLSTAASTPKPQPTPQELAARKRKEQQRRNKIIIITLIVVITVIGAIGGVLWYVAKQKEIERRAELFALTNARDAGQALYISLTNSVNKMDRGLVRLDAIGNEIQAGVEKITGSRLVIAPPPEPEPEPSATPAEPSATNTTEQATNTAVVAAEPPSTTPVADATNTNGVDAAAVADVAPPPEAPAAPPAPEVPDHPVVAPARSALEAIQEIGVINLNLKNMLAEAEAINTAIQTSPTSVNALSNLQTLRTIDANAKDMLSGAEQIEKDKITGNFAKLKAEVDKFQKDLDAQLAAEREAERLRLEAERKERELRDYAERVARELQQAAQDRQGVRMFFDSNNFEEALKTLRQNQANYQTTEGKAAIAITTDRYDYLVRMKTALIASINESPYAWGWGSRAAARDIVKADEKGVYVKGVAQPFEWSGIQAQQMLQMINHYLKLPTVRSSVKREIAFGAAIYCDKFGPQARDSAKKFGDKAMTFGISRENHTRLLENGWQ